MRDANHKHDSGAVPGSITERHIITHRTDNDSTMITVQPLCVHRTTHALCSNDTSNFDRPNVTYGLHIERDPGVH